MSMYGKHPRQWGGDRWLDPPTTDCSGDEPLTVQADSDAVDINKLVARIERGHVPEFRGQPFYGDVSEFDGLQESIIRAQNANALFMQMNARIRERFDNDPVKMISFLADEKNYKEALDLGMVVKRPETAVEAPPPPVPERVG